MLESSGLCLNKLFVPFRSDSHRSLTVERLAHLAGAAEIYRAFSA